MYNIDQLTGIPEMDFEILIKLDIKSLNRYCRATNYESSICNDHYFWMEKFKYDALPSYLIKNIPNHYDDWLTLYRILKITSDSAKETLFVNNVEATRTDNNTTGIINIYRIDSMILKNITNQIPLTNILNVKLIYINDHLYHLKINDQTKYIKINHNDVLNLMTNVYYTMYDKNENYSNIVDEQNISFIININSIQMLAGFRTDINLIYLYRRLSILDTLKYIEK